MTIFGSHLFLILLFVSIISAIVAVYFLLKKKEAPGASYFIYAFIAILIWMLGYILELYGHQFYLKFLGLQIQYILGIPFTPLLWSLSAINFVTNGKHPTKTELYLSGIIPFLTMVLMLTTQYHHIFYYNFRIIEDGNFRFLFKDWGTWFYVHLIYSYTCLLAGTAFLIYYITQSKYLYKTQTIYFLIGISLPWIANVYYVVGMTSYAPLDFTPIAFTFSIIIMKTAISRHGLFDIIPAAKDIVFESMNHGLIVFDNSGRIINVNSFAQNIFGTTALIGKTQEDLFKNNLSKEYKINWGIDESKQSEIFELEINNSVFEIVMTDILGEDKEKDGTIFTFYDITDRKRTEKTLYELNATKDKFFSIIAHDLRNPFFGIMGLTELLTDKEENISEEERDRMVGQIKELSTSTYRMLENLLDWAHSQTGRMIFNPERFDIEQLFDNNLSFLQKNAELKKIKLTSGITANTFVFADKNMVSAILRNIISNAIKFTPECGTITVFSKNFEHHIEISIKDTGVGMDETTIGKLFRLDQTIRSVGTSGEKGTGLGLVLCKEFIEKNNGKIWIESKINEGSIITFSLPLH